MANEDIKVINLKEDLNFNSEHFLSRYDLAYKNIEYYCQVGERPEFNWMICISISLHQLPNLLDVLVPMLSKENICFSIARDEKIIKQMQEGLLGDQFFGQVLRVYPDTDVNAKHLAHLLAGLTKYYRGPAIPSGSHLGGTAYGLLAPSVTQFHLWPFDKIAAPPAQQKLIFLKDEYRIVSILKDDAKGKVFKAVRFDGWRLQWCVIKEGIRNMLLDEAGRDMRDRLQWQYQLHQALHEYVNIPRVYEIFHENDNAYLVIEFLKGKSLIQTIFETYQWSETWIILAPEKRSRLLKHIVEIITLIAKMHQRGYVHRDITPANVFFDKRKKRWVLIDLELAYHANLKVPYLFGTKGYMSPEQIALHHPDPLHDIYSVGALLLTTVTGLHADRFSLDQSDRLISCLLFFTEDFTLAKLIADCLNHNPTERPALMTIVNVLDDYRPVTVNRATSSATSAYDLESITSSLLKNPLLLNTDKMWLSVITEANDFKSQHRTVCQGLYAGLSGVLYFLNTLRNVNIAVEGMEDMIRRSYSYLEKFVFRNAPNVIPGLYYGTAGTAIAISEMRNDNWVSSEVARRLRQCLELPSDSLTVAEGIAGQGIAIMKCLHHLDNTATSEKLAGYIDLLLAKQQRDGAWRIQNARSAGFDYGVAGITYFLMMYYYLYNDVQIEAAIMKSLRWLQKRIHKKDISEASFSHGLTGIAFCFIKAFQVFDDSQYRTCAELVLRQLPKKKYLTVI